MPSRVTVLPKANPKANCFTEFQIKEVGLIAARSCWRV